MKRVIGMTRSHKRFKEFCRRLEGAEGCNFKKDKKDEIRWNCSSSSARTKSRKILKKMGYGTEFVKETMKYFDKHGGHCDCEVLFNVQK